jgi:diguanylate cyclase (GGDEF)-like protein
MAVGEQIRTAVANLRLDADDGTLVQTSISIGVAAARGADLDVDRLTREADKALYRAKEKGRNRVSD